MANMSYAYGSVYVNADNAELSERIFKIIFAVTDKWVYGIHPVRNSAETSICGSFGGSFAGDGRWKFLYNVAELAEDLASDLNNGLAQDQENLAFLESQNFTVYFNFNDEEENNGYFADCGATFSHKAGTPLLSSRVVTDYENRYESSRDCCDDDFDEEISVTA